MKKIFFILTSITISILIVQCKDQHYEILMQTFNYVSKIIEISAEKMTRSINPDTYLTIDEYLNKYNYPLENHKVITEDDYILTLHRIPYGKKTFQKSTKQRPVVFLKHGFLDSSIDWLLLGPGKCLAMILADSGYDVWLGNSRGNLHSLNHRRFNTSVSSWAFWNFSFHEKGYYDLAASIDYIINITNISKLTYIGHSQGTTEALVLTSCRPEYNKKLNLMVLLSPVAYLEHVKSPPILILYKYLHLIKAFSKSFHIYGFPLNAFVTNLGKTFCNNDSPLQPICIEIFQLFSGYDYQQFNRSLITLIVANAPSGSSVKEIDHHAQNIKTGTFRQFDYGIDNKIYYNNTSPPFYNISQITVPVAAFYAKNDFFVTYPDLNRLLKKIPNLIVSSLIPYDLFSHYDFIVANDAKELLYNRVIKVIKKYNT